MRKIISIFIVSVIIFSALSINTRGSETEKRNSVLRNAESGRSNGRLLQQFERT